MNIYFSGVSGFGIGPLAILALDAGYTTCGSDLKTSEMIDLLIEKGANISIGQDGSQISRAHSVQPIDWLVYSASLPEDHAELRFARENNIKISKRDEFINKIIDDKNLKMIAVAGTHGKTTTTGMLIWLFKQLGLPVSYSIGTTISFGPPAQYQPDSKYFIYEADEFDRNFLAFTPELSLIVSMDYDHPDTYPTESEYQSAFQQFVKRSNECITWQSIADEMGKASNITTITDDQDVSEVKLAGLHMRRNAALALATVRHLELANDDQALRAINDFPGTSRRFEKLADSLYSDYAHHPTEIAATIEMAREINPNVVVVYQPHQNIRQHELISSGGYGNCFDGAEKVYWLPTYLSREYQKLDLIPPTELIKSLSNPKLAHQAEMNEQLWQQISQDRVDSKLVVAMSAGDLDPWLREHINR